MGEHTEVSWAEARERAVGMLGDGRPEVKKPAPGDVLWSPVAAPMDVPHYSSSAMDGFAVAGPGSDSGTWRLLAAPAVGAQGRNIHKTGGTLEPGEALPILTGSLIPEGTTSIIRSENATVTESHGGAVLNADYPGDGRDIRPAGQEWHAGETLVEAGVRLSPRHVAMINACGVDTVEVFAKPRVACAFTGNEVITHGVPAPGEVRDAFGDSFPALLRGWGAEVVCADRVPDDPDAVEGWLRLPHVLAADIVVVTGGSGRSGQDFARRFITDSADEVLTDEIACQPGHPTLITWRGSPAAPGTAGQLVIGVPGNPLAAHVTAHGMVAPAVGKLLGAGADATATRTGTVTTEIPALRRDRVRLMPATLDIDGGRTLLTPAPGAHSHMLRGYAAADALIIVPATGLAEGDDVEFIGL